MNEFEHPTPDQVEPSESAIEQALDELAGFAVSDRQREDAWRRS